MLLRRFLSTSCLPPTIRELLCSAAHETKTHVQVNGWVKSIRRQKNVSFAVISDGSSYQGLQAVFSGATLAKRLTNGACVRLSGRLCDSPGYGQEKELQVDGVEVLGESDPETYPIQKQTLSVEYLRDQCHLRARTDAIGAMLRLRDTAQGVIHDFFKNEGFQFVHTPILTSNDCEGAGEAFRIATIPPAAASISTVGAHEFFSRPSYLTVSSQLHLEALSTAISRVYTLSPCFRAERSLTSRHLAEFWMLEAEWAFTKTVDDICRVVEAALKHIVRQSVASADVAVLWKEGDQAKLRALEHAAEAPWPRISYASAITELTKQHRSSGQKFEFEPSWGKPLQSEHERWIAESLIGGPVFVTEYPVHLKPFYMRVNDDGRTVACFDLLVPFVGELAGGSLREERLAYLDSALDSHNLNKEAYGWYLDLRKYGGAPHGGFGLGFERLIGWVSGVDNVRECVAMPRWAGRMLL